jgi:hypothetical protein
MDLMAKKSELARVFDQLSLLVSRSEASADSDPFGFIPSRQDAGLASIFVTDEEPMDVNDWFHVPEPTHPESGFLR